MKSIRIFFIILLSASVAQGQAQTKRAYSQLWGKHGEKWDKEKLPDFTHAGYGEGRHVLPVFSDRVNVKDYGAVGDGITDATLAFRKAIQACKYRGAVYVPEGKYVLSDSLIIAKDGICIQGAGQRKTILLFKSGLEELYPKFRFHNGTKKQTEWSWSGAMILFAGNISDIGIRDLTVKFPDSLYAGHNFHERGYNGVGFSDHAHDGWIDHVTFTGCDLGIWIEKSAHHITVSNWELNFGPKRAVQEISGHHGVNIYGGHNLLENFKVEGRYVHDLSVESEQSVYNVFRHGMGKDLCIDHHNHDQGNNLFTDLDAGQGNRLYHSGGVTPPLGICFYETYWNITADRDLQYCNQWDDQRGQAAHNISVGIKTNLPSNLSDAKENWFETISPGKLYPADLYRAQMDVTNHREF